ncbi:MAG: Hydroxymethylpyrimidine/phosphomethylpyrimidine kinase [Firmicutes bacterium]|nr:Hydroxymethylpyrimidine/phosphomethylpyrimidine kinase [Bacillota bacterium]
MQTALTIAGSDSSGGAGLQADLKTFAAHGVFGLCVVTAVTAQNTVGVFAVEDISRACILAQLAAVYADIPVHAVKIGMVSRRETIIALAESLPSYRPLHVVLDPVMISKSGFYLLQADAIEALKALLLPLADLVTPNIPEATELMGQTIHSLADMEQAARHIVALGAKAALIKGGHLSGEAVDVLYDGRSLHHFVSPRINTPHTHGTGCTLSAAIAANLAQGLPLVRAVELAKAYTSGAIAHGFALGRGVGPTHHFYDLYKRAGIKDSSN